MFLFFSALLLCIADKLGAYYLFPIHQYYHWTYIDGYQKDRIVAEDTEPQKAKAVDFFLAHVTSMGLLFQMSI